MDNFRFYEFALHFMRSILRPFKQLSIFFCIFFSISGCENNVSDTKVRTPSPNAYNSKKAIEKTNSSLLLAITEMPSVTQSFSAVRIAQAKIPIIETAKNLKVNATSSGGIYSETNEKDREILALGLTANKLLFDNGQTDKSILVGELDTNAAVLKAQIAIDQALHDILSSYALMQSSRETEQIIIQFLTRFEERERLVEKAIKIGAVSKSDFLELKSLKNDILALRAKAGLEASNAGDLLNKSLKVHFDSALKELAFDFQFFARPRNQNIDNVQIELLSLKISQLEAEIEIQRLSKKPSANWSASLNNSQTGGTDTTLFAGISIGMPLVDGGVADAKENSLSEQIAALKLEIEGLTEKYELSRNKLDNFLKYYKLQKEILTRKIELSTERIIDLELRTKAGKADLGALAKEILANGQAEIALIQLEYEYFSQVLNHASLTNQTCATIQFCKQINKVFTE